MSELFLFFVKTGANILVGNITAKLLKARKDHIEQVDIDGFIKNCLDRQFDEQFMYSDQKSEIDFKELKDFLKGKGEDLAYEVVTSLDPDAQERCHKTLKEQAIQHAHAITSESKHSVEHFVNNVIGIIEKLLIEEVPQSELAIYAYINAKSHEEHEKTRALFKACMLSSTPLIFQSDIDIPNVDGMPRYAMPLKKNDSNYSLFWTDEPSQETLLSVLIINKHVTLLGEGGAGKTYALKQLYTEAINKGFSPVFLKLKYFPESAYLNRLLSLDSEIQENLIFILDGFDEIGEQHISSFVNKMNASHHLENAYIIVSSRWNFYECQDADNQTLDNFMPYTLKPITDEDKICYLSKYNINSDTFYREVNKKNLESLCLNPFYFVELVEYWKNTSTLPEHARAMNEIIQKRIDTDFRKYRNKKSLKKEQYTIWEALTKLAFSMQWARLSELDDMDYQSCLCRDTRDLLSHISIWNQNMKNAWEFEHNNFREYLAALYLNQKALDGIISLAFFDNHKARPTWMNIVSYLAVIRDSNDLRDWIFENNPSVALAYEPCRFSSEQRATIFMSILGMHEKDDIWISTWGEYSKLASFGGCEETLLYLLAKLQKQISQKHKHNILRVLALFTDLYEMCDKVRQCLLDIACDTTEEISVRTDAIRTMTSLRLFENTSVEKLVQFNGQIPDIYLSEVLYEYLISSGKAADYTHVFLWGAANIDKHNPISMGFLQGLEEGQKAANTIEALEAIFYHYRQHPEQITDHDAIQAYQVCCHTAARLYTPEANPFISCLVSSLPHFFHVSAKDAMIAIREFIMTTRTEALFLSILLGFSPPMNYILIEEFFYDRIAELLLEQYKTGKLPDSELIPWLANRMKENAPWQKIYFDAIEAVTGQRPVLPKRENYQEIRRQGEQRFLDAMFDISLFDVIVKELIDVLGADILVSDLLSERSNKVDFRRADLVHCKRALVHVMNNYKDAPLDSYHTYIDWEWFSLHNINLMLHEDNNLILSLEQHKQVSQVCLLKLESIDLETVAHDETPLYLKNQAKLVLCLVNLLDVTCKKEKILGMLMVPAFWLTRKYEFCFPGFITSKVDSEILKQRVLENVAHKSHHKFVAICHIAYCHENHLLEAKDLAIKMLAQSENGETLILLHYLYKSIGVTETCKYSLPFCKDKKMLESLACVIPISQYPPQLETRIFEEYTADHGKQWQGILIQRNYPQAIQDYYLEALRYRRIPGYSRDTSIPQLICPVGSISDVSQLDILISLLALSCEEDFLDARGLNGLYFNSSKAIKNIAMENYDIVVQLLEKSKEDVPANSSIRDTLADLIQTICEQHSILEDKPLPFSEIKGIVFGDTQPRCITIPFVAKYP